MEKEVDDFPPEVREAYFRLPIEVRKFFLLSLDKISDRVRDRYIRTTPLFYEINTELETALAKFTPLEQLARLEKYLGGLTLNDLDLLYDDEYEWTVRQVFLLKKVELERDFELQKTHRERVKLLGVEQQDEQDSEYDPAKRGLTRQLAMMLIDDLFPNLKDASNKAKAEFLGLLTGWSADGLRNKWSDYRRGNEKSLAQDAATVAEWKTKLKISDQQK